MGKVQYIKCPRCDLNYISSTEKLCDVCQAELSRKLGTSEEEDDDMILCPVCNKNYIYLDEEMCEQCAGEADKGVEEGGVVPDIERDEDWRAYLDDEKDIAIPAEEMEISLSELETEEGEEGAEEDEPEDDIVDVLDDFDE